MFQQVLKQVAGKRKKVAVPMRGAEGPRGTRGVQGHGPPGNF